MAALVIKVNGKLDKGCGSTFSRQEDCTQLTSRQIDSCGHRLSGMGGLALS
jgi:hypothetical protein